MAGLVKDRISRLVSQIVVRSLQKHFVQISVQEREEGVRLCHLPFSTLFIPPIRCSSQFHLANPSITSSYLDRWADIRARRTSNYWKKLFSSSLVLGEIFKEQKLQHPVSPLPTPHLHKCTIMSRKQMQILTLLTKFIQHLYIKQNQDCLVLYICAIWPWKRNHVKSFLNSSGGGMGPAGGGRIFWYIPQTNFPPSLSIYEEPNRGQSMSVI